jgi:hypothetical protein
VREDTKKSMEKVHLDARGMLMGGEKNGSPLIS